jgi:hypothetical protein
VARAVIVIIAEIGAEGKKAPYKLTAECKEIEQFVANLAVELANPYGAWILRKEVILNPPD